MKSSHVALLLCTGARAAWWKQTPAAELALSPPAASTPATCSVAAAAPSLAPYRIGLPDGSAPGDIRTTTPNASVTPLDSTVLAYSVPAGLFGNSSTSTPTTCALQFRLPFCTDLASGYPCFRYSGMEQEMASGSGMVFSLLNDTGGGMAWNSTELHQVYPGEPQVLGTFECGGGGGGGGEEEEDVSGAAGDRQISWLVSSVRQFVLQFMQAGVGPDARFQDGVGAWIVPCS